MSALSAPLSSRLPRTDRRELRRRRIATPATIMTREQLLDGIAVEVSCDGLRVLAKSSLRVGSTLSVALIIDGEVIEAVAVVRWSKLHGAGHHASGLSFETMEHESRVHLARFCGLPLS